MAAEVYPGPFAQEAKITTQMLLHSALLPRVETVKKGLILELHGVLKSNLITWATFSKWIQSLFNSEELKPWALRKSVTALSTRFSKMRKNFRYKAELDKVLQEPFTLPRRERRSQPPKPTKATPQLAASNSRCTVSAFDIEALTMANQSLAAEVTGLKTKFEEYMKEYQKLKEKSLKYNPHNVQRREKRKQAKITQLQTKVKTLESKLKYKHKSIDRKLHSKVAYYKKKSQQKQKEIEEIENQCDHCDMLDKENATLKQVNKDILEANAELKGQLQAVQANTLKTMEEGRYSNEVRMCVMELLSHNVGVRKVEPVMRAVLKLAGIECERLPHHTAINDMLAEAHAMAQLQLTETLTQEGQHNVLHTDGTSKFGHKYAGYQISTEQATYTLGIRETESGSAQTALNTLQEILDDLTSAAAARKGAGTETGKIILSKIKSTMSDRAATEKAFNDLLSQYRSEILPTVLQEWEKLSDEERQSMSRMYNFYCGMHFVTNMAEHTSEAMRLFENAYSDDNNNECRTVRLIRLVCKAFQRRADEKSGYPIQFGTYLRRHGIESVPLAQFRGNRFNIIFFDGARVYYLHKHIIDFLTNCLGPRNKLLKAILEDASNDLYVAGCKALGLIDKLITGPLWRVMESDLHILDMSNYYIRLLQFVVSASEDTTEFLTGETVPFPGISIKKDEVWAALVTPSPLDDLVQQILQAVFKSVELLARRMLADHLPGGRWEEADEVTREQTKLVKKTNTVSERDFGKLDRLLREKPNASTLALEAHILFSNNKTAEWLREKSRDEQDNLLKMARSLAPAHKRKFKERLVSIQEQRRQAQEMHESELQRKEQRLLLEKERLTSEIVMAGLWQTSEQVEAGLSQLKSKTAKSEALKAQLKFRKTVLQQKHSEKTIYIFSRMAGGKRIQHSPAILKENLLTLIEAAHSIPPITTCSDPILVGKKIAHQFKENKKLVVYNGKVVSQVPGFSDWFNIVYDNEPDTVYTYKLLEDYNNGDLKFI